MPQQVLIELERRAKRASGDPRTTTLARRLVTLSS